MSDPGPLASGRGAGKRAKFETIHPALAPRLPQAHQIHAMWRENEALTCFSITEFDLLWQPFQGLFFLRNLYFGF